MNEDTMDFAKRYDDFIDTSPDYVREIAYRFYELGKRDAQKNRAVIYIPYPVYSKELRRKLLGGRSEK